MSDTKNSKIVLNNCIIDYFRLMNYSNRNKTVIYEVVRVIDKKLLFIEDHLDRFVQSFKLSKSYLGITKKEIYNQLINLIEVNNLDFGNIKFEVQIDVQTYKQDFLAYIIPHYYPTQDEYLRGVNVSVLKATRNNPNVKKLDPSIRELSNQLIKNKQVFEVVLVNEYNFVTEGSRSNIFMIKDGVVQTPQNEDILPGITRQKVIKICNDLTIKCFQTNILLQDVFTMDAVFLTGTSPKVLPVKNIDDQSFNTNNPILKAIKGQYDQLVEDYLKNAIIFN
jgi:branched-chain amino acid aminotransferase